MTMTPHLLQSESPTNELAMLLVGDYKSGKSWLGATAPGNILFLEMDRRLKALASHPNVKNIYGLEFADNLNAAPNEQPKAFNELMEVINRLEESPRLRDLHETFRPCDEKLVDTIIFDSIQSISDSARRFINHVAPDVAKVFVMGKKSYRVSASYHSWGGEMEMVTGAILQARALLHCKQCLKSVTFKKNAEGVGILTHTDPKIVDHVPTARAMNVICILHECMEQAENSTQANPVYTGKIEVYPRRYNSLLMYFNEVWRLRRESGRIPTVQFDPDNKFVQAATALGLPQKIEGAPDIQAILRLARNGHSK